MLCLIKANRKIPIHVKWADTHTNSRIAVQSGWINCFGMN